MAIFEYLLTLLIPLMLIFPLSLFTIIISHRKTSSTPTNWPVLGMLPALLKNAHRFNDFVNEFLSENGGTFAFKGPWFGNLDMLFTCDPANIHHVFSRNFANYPKGPEFKEIFEVLGDGIFNADFELWEFHRRTTLQFMSNAGFYAALEKSIWEKIENGLFRALGSFSDEGVPFDLQDVLQRFTFDSACKLILDYDPESLRLGLLRDAASEEAFNDVTNALFHRQVTLERVWKLQRWLGVGQERKLIEAWKVVDDMIYPQIANFLENPDRKDYLMLKSFRKAYEEGYKIVDRMDSDLTKFLRDVSLNLLFAGRDTTSVALTWLFYLTSKNPSVEDKIVKEIEALLQAKDPDKKWRNFTVEDAKKLVYLHAVICETLRLYPPVPIEFKAAARSDTLPSGANVRRNERVLASFYSVGRMKSLWGEDCLEFKPERWIDSDGSVKREPSHKFPAFNVGPRACTGKEMAFIQMKMVASAVIYHYRIEAVDGDRVRPKDSITLPMKGGFMVRLSRK